MGQYDGDPTDFTGNPERGWTKKPNDFFSYYLPKEEAEGTEFLLYGGPELFEQCRPFIAKHVGGIDRCIMVHFKEGVNMGTVRGLCERLGGSVGPNRKVRLA